jgi:hypothetical protein
LGSGKSFLACPNNRAIRVSVSNDTLVASIAPADDKLFSFTQLATRWGCNPRIAAQRAKELGLPLIHFNDRVICVRLSDVLRTEWSLEEAEAKAKA